MTTSSKSTLKKFDVSVNTLKLFGTREGCSQDDIIPRSSSSVYSPFRAAACLLVIIYYITRNPDLLCKRGCSHPPILPQKGQKPDSLKLAHEVTGHYHIITS
jgi:hypothetical protein